MLCKKISFLSLGVAMVAAPACAQRMDYGSLEQIFGEPVTTSATGKPQRSSDAPVTLEVVTADDIRRSGATTIPDILRHTVGIDVQQWSTASADVSIRGYNQPASPRVLVLVNGRQVYIDHYGLTSWNGLPVQLAEIRQIEIVKGPNTALFGFNAAQGVINIITYNPLYDDVNAVTAEIGTQAHRGGSAVKTIRLGPDVGVRLSMGGFRAQNFDTAKPGTPDRTLLDKDPYRGTLSLDSQFRLSGRAQGGLEVTHARTGQTDMLPTAELTNATYTTSSVKLNYSLETSFGGVEANLYRNWADVDYRRDLTGIPSLPLTFSNDVTVFNLQDVFKLGPDHTVRLSGEYRHNTSSLSPDNAGSRIYYDTYSAGAMWDWSISDTVTWTNAARLDYLVLGYSGEVSSFSPFTKNDYGRTLATVSYNSGLVWKIGDDRTLRLASARGIKVPSLIDFGALNGLSAAGTGVTSGNPRVDPTVVTSHEISYDWAIRPLDTNLRVSLFRETIADITSSGGESTVPSLIHGGRAILLSQNIGSSAATGLEIGLKGHIGTAWRWHANYGFVSVDDDLRNVIGAKLILPEGYERSTPQHRVSLGAGYSAGAWEFDLFSAYRSGARGIRNDRLPSGQAQYSLVDVPAAISLSGRVGYTIQPGLIAALAAQAANFQQYRETFAPELERRVFLSLSWNY